MAKIIFLCIVFELLSSCEYFKSTKSSSSSKESEDPKKNTASLKEEDPLVKKGLPPDPGEAGKETLLGIDSDGDGVRDDMQRFIYEKYHNQPLLEKALMQYAKDQQNTLHYLNDREKAILAIRKELDSQDCVLDVYEIIYGELPMFLFTTKDWAPNFTNTMERFKASRILDSYFSGQRYSGSQYDTPGSTCAIEIDPKIIKDYKDKMQKKLKKGK